MLSGCHIPQELRQIIYIFHIIHKKTPEEIFADLFLYDSTKISLRWLIDLCQLFDSGNEMKIREYLSGENTRKLSAGYPQMLSNDAKE